MTFTIARGPLHRVESVEAAGNARVTAADLAPLLQIKAGDPFVEARVGLVGAAITELYRVRGFAQAVVKPNIQVLPPATARQRDLSAGRDPFRDRRKGRRRSSAASTFEGTDRDPADAAAAR